MFRGVRRLVVAAAFAIGGCGHASQRPSAHRAAEHAAAPVPWSAADRRRVSVALRGSFAADAFDAAGLIVLARDGSALFRRRWDVPMAPASTLKLLIAATSLDTLGPARRFETSFVALGQPRADGTLEGPLWLVGGGDPVLESNDLRAGVGALVRAGVRRIAGDLIVDATAFSGPEQNAAWDEGDLGEDYAAGTSALSLDWNVVQFRVTPSVVGLPAGVAVIPRNRNVGFDGSILTDYATNVHIDRDPTPTALHRNDFTLRGRIAAGVPQSFYLPVVGIPWFVGGAAAAMLAERGVALNGSVRVDGSPLAGIGLWLHRSPPLAVLVRQMLVFSDNHIAEQLLRSIGYEGRRGGSDQAGLAIERAWLVRAGIGTAGVHAVDGSGLSPRNLLPPYTLAAIVLHELTTRDGDVFLHALPLVGREGTVRAHRLVAARGRARAKSGHIEDVNALAGTVLTRRHGRVEFAFIVNGPRSDDDVVTRSEDRALDALAEF